MRNIIIFSLFMNSLFMMAPALAQSLLLDANLRLVADDKKAKYYMNEALTEQNGTWPAVIYYIDDNTAYFKGAFNGPEPAKKNIVSDFEFYTRKGVIERQGYRNNEGNLDGIQKVYSSGVLKQEQQYLNGVLEGEQKTFYSNGHVKEKFNMLNGKRSGENLIYRENGAVRKLITWLDDEMHGPMLNYFENGNIDYEMNFQHGQRHGKYKGYYFNGQLKSEGQSEFGQYHGIFHYYDKAGNKTQQESYKNNDKHGVALSWHANGQLSSEQNFVDDELHGLSTEYDESGKVTKVFSYVGGKKVGEQRVFHTDSETVQAIYEYNTDSRLIAKKEFNEHGAKVFDLSVRFDENHNRISDEYRYRDGLVISRLQEDQSKAWKLTEFFTDGELTARTESIDGKYHNLYFTQLSDHKAKKQHYKHGVLHGKFTVTQFGEVIEQGEYFEGVEYGYWENDWDGKRIYNYNKKGEYHGEVKKYFRFGGLDRLTTYFNGIKHGPTESYTEEGMLWSKGNFVDGKEDGEWQTIIPEKSKTAMWTGVYRAGEKVGKWVGMYPDGSSAGELQFDD